MHWIIQTNLSNGLPGCDLERQLAALDEIGASYTRAKLVPFFGIFDPEVQPPSGPVIALGSTTMLRVAQQRGWNPGVFFNENFRFEVWRTGLGADNLFNGDAVVRRFADLEVDHDTFVRPCEDLKAFAGYVTSADEWKQWKRRVLEGEKSSELTQLGADTMIVAAKPRPIYREFRMFVVGEKVITGSLYRTIDGPRRSPEVDPEVYAFAEKMTKRWSPAEVYALDVAEGDEGLKVLEINCFNGAGAYESDLVQLYRTIEERFG